MLPFPYLVICKMFMRSIPAFLRSASPILFGLCFLFFISKTVFCQTAIRDFNKGNFTSPDQLIQGKVSGVQMISNNGAPGGAITVKIRGNSALVGTGQPLYVVDGVPLDGRSLQPGNDPLNFLNSADIASI